MGWLLWITIIRPTLTWCVPPIIFCIFHYYPEEHLVDLTSSTGPKINEHFGNPLSVLGCHTANTKAIKSWVLLSSYRVMFANSRTPIRSHYFYICIYKKKELIQFKWCVVGISWKVYFDYSFGDWWEVIVETYKWMESFLHQSVPIKI